MKKNTIFILTMIMVLLLSTSSIIERDQQITLEENISNTTINEQIATASASAVWATTNKATNIVSAPYDNINTTIASLGSGSGLYILERDYGYFYVQRTVNGKYQRGYVKMTDVNYSSYSWVNHNIFEKGTTNFTSSSQAVLSGPGTTNTYESIGTIYQGENPLLILRTELNTYNNVTYAFIQYMVSSTGKFKRGWVPYSSVKVDAPKSDTEKINENAVFYLESVATNKMIQAVADSNKQYVTQQNSNIYSSYQMFEIEKASTGYYRFILQKNTDLSLQVLGNQMAEGSQLGVATKGSANSPSKAEEFEVTINDDGSFSLASRCTGRYRSVDLYGGSSANDTSIISSKTANVSNQKWRFQPKIIGDKDISIIKVGDSTGRACVKLYNEFENLNVYYANRTLPDDSQVSMDVSRVSNNTKFSTTHVNFAIKNSSMFYINGHGNSTPVIFGNGWPHQITPSNIGFNTNDRVRWGILGPCSQLKKETSAVTWANYALRNGVRGILGFYDSAPGDSGSSNATSELQIRNMEWFIDNINDGDSLVSAWRDANNGNLLNASSAWAAIYHADAETDKFSDYNRKLSNPSTSTIYYFSHESSESQISTSAINSVLSKLEMQNSQIAKIIDEKEWSIKDNVIAYKTDDYSLVNGQTVTINQNTALTKIAEFIINNNISIEENSTIICGAITKSRLSDDNTCFVDEQIIAHTFTVLSNNKENNMYFEVNDRGVISFKSISFGGSYDKK